MRNYLLLFGAIATIAGRVMMVTSDSGPTLLGALLAVGGAAAFVFGCCIYAREKGYHWAVGLLGIFFLLGLAVLYFLPER
jgi:drug/metabolite transporter (DMT)-like permease